MLAVFRGGMERGVVRRTPRRVGPDLLRVALPLFDQESFEPGLRLVIYRWKSCLEGIQVQLEAV